MSRHDKRRRFSRDTLRDATFMDVWIVGKVFAAATSIHRQQSHARLTASSKRVSLYLITDQNYRVHCTSNYLHTFINANVDSSKHYFSIGSKHGLRWARLDYSAVLPITLTTLYHSVESHCTEVLRATCRICERLFFHGLTNLKFKKKTLPCFCKRQYYFYANLAHEICLGEANP